MGRKLLVHRSTNSPNSVGSPTSKGTKRKDGGGSSTRKNRRGGETPSEDATVKPNSSANGEEPIARKRPKRVAACSDFKEKTSRVHDKSSKVEVKKNRYVDEEEVADYECVKPAGKYKKFYDLFHEKARICVEVYRKLAKPVGGNPSLGFDELLAGIVHSMSTKTFSCGSITRDFVISLGDFIYNQLIGLEETLENNDGSLAGVPALVALRDECKNKSAFSSSDLAVVERYVVVHGQIILQQFAEFPDESIRKCAFVTGLSFKMEQRHHTKLLMKKKLTVEKEELMLKLVQFESLPKDRKQIPIEAVRKFRAIEIKNLTIAAYRQAHDHGYGDEVNDQFFLRAEGLGFLDSKRNTIVMKFLSALGNDEDDVKKRPTQRF